MLAYLIGLAILAYIVYRFAKAYDGLARELREIRVKCISGGGNEERMQQKEIYEDAPSATGVVVGATKQLAGFVGSMAKSWA
jgi:hypothetical protein